MASTIKSGTRVMPELNVTENVTTAANGVFTAQVAQDATYLKVVTVTSGGATEYLVLPKALDVYIGRIILLKVGSNGYELVTPDGSGDTINGVDADGTNQYDVAADTVVRVTQVTATGWIAETIAATTIAVTAPDND